MHINCAALLKGRINAYQSDGRRKKARWPFGLRAESNSRRVGGDSCTIAHCSNLIRFPFVITDIAFHDEVLQCSIKSGYSLYPVLVWHHFLRLKALHDRSDQMTGSAVIVEKYISGTGVIPIAITVAAASGIAGRYGE
jgi:hypothetical protein